MLTLGITGHGENDMNSKTDVDRAPVDAGVMLTFDDALRIAKGCFDYGGGYRSNDGELGIFHHGIKTVVNALEGARKSGMSDLQSRVLHRIGST